MEVYNLLSEKARAEFDAVVLSLMIRGKKLDFAMSVATFSFGRRLKKDKIGRRLKKDKNSWSKSA